MAWSGVPADSWLAVPEQGRQVSLAQRRDGALAGSFFGMIAGVLHLVLSLLVGLAGWWKDAAPTFGRFILAQSAYAVVIVAGGAFLGAAWSLRTSRSGRIVLWLIGAAVVSGAIISIRKGPFWHWDLATWGWLALMTPAFAWVFASGRSTTSPARPERS